MKQLSTIFISIYLGCRKYLIFLCISSHDSSIWIEKYSLRFNSIDPSWKLLFLLIFVIQIRFIMSDICMIWVVVCKCGISGSGKRTKLFFPTLSVWSKHRLVGRMKAYTSLLLQLLLHIGCQYNVNILEWILLTGHRTS